MSRMFEALRQVLPELDGPAGADPSTAGSLLSSVLSAESEQLQDAPKFLLPGASGSRLVALNEPQELAAEKFRVLAAKLKLAQKSRSLKSVLISSAASGDGKTVVSANLAITLASQGERTLLIDGDLHRASLSRLFQVENQNGIGTWHSEKGSVTNSMLQASGLPLWFLPAGYSSEQPISIIQSPAMSAMMKQVSAWFSWIIVDSPPLLPLGDAAVWSTITDSTLLVIRHALTPKRLFLKAIEQFDRAKLLGIALNDAVTGEQKYYEKYYPHSRG